MATTRREPTIPATGAKRDGRVSLPSSSIPHHIKKTPIKSSSSSPTTTKRSTITTSVPRTTATYKPILKPTINTSRLNDPSRKETSNRTSATTRSNNTNSSSSSPIQHNKKSILLNKRSSGVKPLTFARLQRPSIQGGRISGGTTSTTSNKLPAPRSASSSSTSKPAPVSSSARLSARPAPVDRRKNVAQSSSAVWKPKANSSTSVVRKTTSANISSSSIRKDYVNGVTKKEKNNPKIATLKSGNEVKTQDNHKDELGDRPFVTESNNDNQGLANINVDHDHDELETLPDMSEMPNEHLGDPTLSDHMEQEIVKISDNNHDVNVDDHDEEVLPPASQDQDELDNTVDHKTHDPQVVAEEGVINTSAVENEENWVEKTVESADYYQQTEAISKEEEEDQKNNMINAATTTDNVNGGDEEQTTLETVGLELEKEEVAMEGANNKANVGGGDGEEQTDKAPAAAEETKNTRNNNVNLQGSSGGSSSSGKLNRKKDKAVYNDVIEETSKKLMDQNRRNKVKALAGAFETVISLQDSNTTKPAATN